MTGEEAGGPVLEVVELGIGAAQIVTEAGVTTCLLVRAAGHLGPDSETVTWDLAFPQAVAPHLLDALATGARMTFPDLFPSPAAATSPAHPGVEEASNLRNTWEHILHDLGRADLTVLGAVAALFALLQAITQISSIPRAVFPFLTAAALLGYGVVLAAVWTLWPRRITATPKEPGSWLHARAFDTPEALIAAYAAWSSAAIAAGQTLALAPVAFRKWAAVRVVLPLFCATVAVLLAGLIVGLGVA